MNEIARMPGDVTRTSFGPVEPAIDDALSRFIGRSAPMRALYELLGKVAPSTASVLFVGESGTGKELAARTLHDMSPRRRGPFVAVNCGAIPDTLIEGELFGHEKGAFTGAGERKAGCFEMANLGTLFLDELTAMPLASQAKLLRALEERSFRRLRGSEEIRVDVRLVVAVNEDPEVALREGRLREDLYYRVNVFAVHLPPLRERREDILPLAEHFARNFAEANHKTIEGITPEGGRLLGRHDWPGNVRELRNVMERAVILSRGSMIGTEVLPTRLSSTMLPALPERLPPRFGEGRLLPSQSGTTLEEATRWLVLRTLEATDYNKTRAAGMLGVSAKTVYNKLKVWTASGHEDARAAAVRCRERWHTQESESSVSSLEDPTREPLPASF